MITFDYAARQQNEGSLMNRYALDGDPAQAQEGSWEALSGLPVLPRRSPWITQYEDVESDNPKVSNMQVPATSQNIADLAYMFSRGTTTSAPASISESALIAAVTQPNVITAIVNALPVVEFSCPE